MLQFVVLYGSLKLNRSIPSMSKFKRNVKVSTQTVNKEVPAAKIPPSKFAQYLWGDKLDFFRTVLKGSSDGIGFFKFPGRTIVIANPTLVEEASRNPLIQRSPESAAPFIHDVGENTIVVEGEKWKQHHKAMVPKFQPTHNKELWVKVIAEQTQIALQKLESKGGKVDLPDWVSRFAWDAMCMLQFSKLYAYTGRNLIMKLIGDAFPMFINRMLFKPLFALPKWPVVGFLSKKYASHLQLRADTNAFLQNIIDERREAKAAGQTFDDLLEVFLQMQSDGILDNQGVIDEGKMVTSAGQDTTAFAGGVTLCLLGQNPNVEQKLREEVRRVVKGTVPTLQELEQLTYTKSVIEEALGIYPSAPFFFRGVVEDTQIGEYPLYKGDTLIFSSALSNEFYVPDPYNFTPGRKLENKFSRYPFAWGHHICMGMHLANLELLILLAMVYLKYDHVEVGLPNVAVETTYQHRSQSAQFVERAN